MIYDIVYNFAVQMTLVWSVCFLIYLVRFVIRYIFGTHRFWSSRVYKIIFLIGITLWVMKFGLLGLFFGVLVLIVGLFFLRQRVDNECSK